MLMMQTLLAALLPLLSGTPDAAPMSDAETLLAKVSQAYQDAPTMTDSFIVRINFEGGEDLPGLPKGEQKQEVKLSIGKNGQNFIDLSGMAITTLDDTLYFERSDIRRKYLAVPLQGSVRETMEGLFPGGGNALPVHFGLRDAKTSEDAVAALGMGMFQGMQLLGREETKGKDGVIRSRLNLSIEGGEMQVTIANKTNLIHGVSFNTHPPQAPPNLRMVGTIEFNPQVRNALLTPISFDPGKRKKVTELKNFRPEVIAKGEIAPTFNLPTLEGQMVSSVDLRGKIIVLDFWATWCGPCRMGLPFLQKFDTWAKDSGLPVVVYAINIWEKVPGQDKIDAMVGKYWASQKFTMTTLMDYKNTLPPEYGFQGIPATVIIDPDGVITEIHTGFAPNMDELLKKEVQDILKSKG